jgi:hypothetical protein
LLRYRSKNIIASRRAGSALQKRLLLYKKQKKLKAKAKNIAKPQITSFV